LYMYHLTFRLIVKNLTMLRLAEMKESYERKVQDLQKVKMQNIQLLSIAGTPEYYTFQSYCHLH
jgi:hypothetical protein